ncbi:S41 family peptidase [Nubsella zeaxanthinifaciens]|uniref:S41 family peptidase n=1 Tax=Nubsella zeaxanthinifaciens TaxID=392412 RepID=UPI000DE47EB5|nr:S41 family peptidase [Nubsella zeaxanthinifaciens]
MRKTTIAFLLLLGITLLAQKGIAQENLNQADLKQLYTALQQTPSYKKLKKNDKSYAALYEKLNAEIASADDKLAFKLLSKLLIEVNDNHLALYSTADSSRRNVLSKVSGNIDSLKKELLLKDVDSLEGIYYSGESELGIYASSPNNYLLVSLANGNLLAELFKTSYSGCDLIWYANNIAPFNLIKNVRLVNGVLTGLPISKQKNKNYATLIRGKEHFELKTIDNEIGYLRLSSFSSSNDNIKKSAEFYASIVDHLPEKYLIVDVRNNGGGGYKTSGKFIDLLKKYKGHVFILQNSATVSNAEQFILALKARKNVTTLGEQTRGMITFGSNYGKKIMLPSGRFAFYPTDMKGVESEFLYESKGVNPDVNLDAFKGDWIEQTIDYIKNKFDK